MTAPRVALLLALAALCPAPLFARRKPLPTLETGIVVRQSLDSYNAGEAYMPLFGGIVGAPIVRRSNLVVVDTPGLRMTWSEADKKTLVFAEGDSVQFYREKNYYVVPEGRHKKFRFVLIHAQARR